MTLCWWCASWRVIKRLGDLSAAPAFVDQKTTKFAHRKACPAQPLVWILKFIYKSYGYDNFLNFGNHAVGFCSQVYPPGYTCLVRNGVCPQIAYAFCTFSHEGHSYCRCKNPNFEKSSLKSGATTNIPRLLQVVQPSEKEHQLYRAGGWAQVAVVT